MKQPPPSEWNSTGRGRIPQDEMFRVAVAHLMEQSSECLQQFPLWKTKFQKYLISEFGAIDEAAPSRAEGQTPDEFDMEEEEWKAWSEEADAHTARKPAGRRGKSSRG
jgi:hypothetical protein